MNKILSSTLILISMLLPVMAFGQAVDLAKAVGELTDKLVSVSKGKVVGVEGDIIYINLGQKEGILEGNKLEVVRLGEPLRGGIGYKETIVGEVEVTRVRETASITKVIQKSGEIKEGDQVYQLRLKGKEEEYIWLHSDDRFMIDNLGGKSKLIESAPILRGRGSRLAFTPETDIQGSMIWDTLDERASSISVTISLIVKSERTHIFFPKLAIKAP